MLPTNLLLTSLYKLYVVVVFQKVRSRVKEYVSWTQAGFICERSCGNNLWILRRVSERAIEFNVPVYCVLVSRKQCAGQPRAKLDGEPDLSSRYIAAILGGISKKWGWMFRQNVL